VENEENAMKRNEAFNGQQMENCPKNSEAERWKKQVTTNENVEKRTDKRTI
jgi:hypothetical protein